MKQERRMVMGVGDWGSGIGLGGWGLGVLNAVLVARLLFSL